ncbi:MAG: hypothetical protein K1W28_05035 [Lachnospiraceae bacterium]
MVRHDGVIPRSFYTIDGHSSLTSSVDFDLCGVRRILAGKAFFQPRHAPILLELPQGTGAEHGPRPVVHVQQPRPQFRVVVAELSQLVNALEGTAPARSAVVYLIQPAPSKTVRFIIYPKWMKWIFG